MQIPHPSVAEIMGQAGYDWVAVDLEHGSIGVHQLPDLFRALELGGTLPLARLAQGQTKDCKQALDAGSGGVIVPMVESASQLEKVRDACRWPPTGVRGVSFSRANLFGKHFEAYAEEAQEGAGTLDMADSLMLCHVSARPREMAARLGTERRSVAWLVLCQNYLQLLKWQRVLGPQADHLDASPLLSRAARQLRQPFLDLITELGRRRYNSIAWWASRLSERNTMVSPSSHDVRTSIQWVTGRYGPAGSHEPR